MKRVTLNKPIYCQFSLHQTQPKATATKNRQKQSSFSNVEMPGSASVRQEKLAQDRKMKNSKK